MKKLNLFNFTTVKHFNLNHNLRALLVLLLFTLSVGNVWGFSSKPVFKVGAVTGTPSGAGVVYGYRGGGDNRAPYDSLRLNITSGWADPTTNPTLVSDITVEQPDADNLSSPGNQPDGYKKLDRSKTANDKSTIQSVYVLHMYFYAKPNNGYQFDGWYQDQAGKTKLVGSTTHYPIPGMKPYYAKKDHTNGYPQETMPTKAVSGETEGECRTYSGAAWVNNKETTAPAGSGWYNNYEFNYLRYVYEIDRNTPDGDKTVYAKFSIIPRHFKFVGTELAGFSYTAAGTKVGATTAESGNITSNIALSATFEESKYDFKGWQYSVGTTGTKVDIPTTISGGSATATYTFVVDRGYPTVNYATNPISYNAYTMVYIWPIVSEKVDYVASVVYDNDTTSYASWDKALTAAKALDGAEIILKKDVEGIDEVQTINKDMTLNLNGHTITGSVNKMFTVSESGTDFTLCDNTLAGAGRIVLNISGGTTYAMTVANGAKLILQSGGVTATNNQESGTSRGIEIQSGGTLEMNGGTVYAQSAKNAYALINRGTTTINNGFLQSRAKGTSAKGTGVTSVAFYNTGTSATIYGGTFTATADSTTAYAIEQYNSTTLTINNAIANATAGKSGAYALYRYNDNNGKIIVNDGKYKATTPVSAASKSAFVLKGGIYSSYTNIRSCTPSGYGCYELPYGTDWQSGYRFIVKSEEGHPSVCKIIPASGETTYYESLADALAYANNNPLTEMSIILIAFEHTLPAGNYTLPRYADLIVPYSVDQAGTTGASPVRVVNNSTPSVFRTLTLASGANIDAFGKIEAGGRQSMNGTGATGGGIPSGAYGHLVLNSGSSITLENGSCLYAWGFVTGSGEINARRGSTTYEMFQLYGWSGGTNIIGYYKKTFPITEYFIQNIEAPVKYHPGSRLISAAAEYVPTFSTPVTADVVNVIGVDGDIAMFLMAEEDDSEDTWVRKYYDPTTDQQVYEVNSSARLGSLQIDFKDLPTAGTTTTIKSSDYELPLTHNMKIHLLTGSMGITQSTMLLPGVQLEVDKEAILSINAGQNLYVFDDAEWGNKVYSNVPAHKIKYRPGGVPNNTIRNTSTAAGLGDAKLFVHGAFDVKGKLYTTPTGANIYSTNEDAGTINFTSAAASSNGSVTIYSGTGSDTETATMVPALLRNGDNSTTNTSGTTAGKSFAYSDGKWQCWTQDGCFYVDNTNTYYAKPADYVALLNGKTENADHTYTSADGTRTFILVEGCQWWEVELEDAEKGLWHCTHPLNDVYYYYNSSAWEVKKQTVVWKNFDGTTVATYTNVPYKTTPVFNSTTPSRPMDAYYTYDFDKWEPALAPITTDMVYTATYESKDRKYTIIFKNEDGSVIETDYCTMGQVPVCSKEPSREGYNLVWSPTIAAVTGDAEYQATFTNVVAASYLITFKNYNSTQTLQSGQVTTGTMPVYSGATPTKPSTEDQQFTWLGWEPALHNVDADAIYVPTFTASPITYAIKWEVNGVITKQETVNKGVTPSYGSIPTKESTDQYTFAFTGWNPAVGPASADVTYVAQFSSTARTYTVTLNTNGGTINAGDVTSYTCGTAAVLPTNVTKDNYVFVGWYDNSGLTGSAVSTIAADAYGNKSYWAKWTLNTHDLSISATPEGYGSVTSSSVTNIPHGEAVTVKGNTFTVNGTTVTATPTTADAQYTYKFDHWNNVPATVTDDVTNIEAVFTRSTNTYTVTWKNGDVTLETDENVAYGVTPHFDGETPTKAADAQYTYTFSGWSPVISSVLGDVIYTAQFGSTVNQYEVTFNMKGHGAAISSQTKDYGSKVDQPADPSEAGYTFVGWYKEDACTNAWNFASDVVNEATTLYAKWTLVSSVTLEVKKDEQITINSNETVTTTIVHADGKLDVSAGTLSTTDLILEASENASGEITGEGTIDADNVYFHLSHEGGFKARTWYAVAVPWEVLLPGEACGVYIKNGETIEKQYLGTTFDLIYYDGASRAQGKTKAWRYVEDDEEAQQFMDPGRAYMIYLTKDAEVIRFQKRTNANFHMLGVKVKKHDSSNTDYKSWNGIANPATYHAFVNVRATDGKGQVYNADTKGYDLFYMSTQKLVVGQPIFVQVPDKLFELSGGDAATVAVSSSSYNPVRRRAKEQALTRYELMLATSDADVTDRVIVRMDEEKTENEYVIGQDLVKMGVSNIVPQMWINRYDSKMCINTVAGFDNTADYPLGIFAPKNGEYDLFIDDQPNDETMLYLTYDGEAIWNLSYGGYVASLDKGTNTHYGLRIAKKAPQITTGIEETTIQNGEAVRKVLVNDKVYIIRNGEIYSVTGQKAK